MKFVMSLTSDTIKNDFDMIMEDNDMNTDNIFLKPEKPFLLIAEDKDGEVSYSWLETEEELIEVAAELKSEGLTITDSIEIGSVRDIKVQ
jgi:hypothetical protein